MISDGYGTPSAGEVLASWDGWLRSATDRIKPRMDPGYEDLLQEARIEFWRQYEALAAETPENRRRYALHRAKLKITKVDNPRYREKQTGHLRSGTSVTTTSLDALENHEALLGHLDAIEALDQIALAYHYGEIHAAISALPERHRGYVLARFWAGLTDVEIARRAGVAHTTVRYHWRSAIVPALKKELGHLADIS